MAVLLDNYVSSSGAMEEEERLRKAEEARSGLQVESKVDEGCTLSSLLISTGSFSFKCHSK